MLVAQGAGDGDWGRYVPGSGDGYRQLGRGQYYNYGFGFNCSTGYGAGTAFGGYDGKQGCGAGNQYAIAITYMLL
jgi:hypothetical protein